MSDIVRDPYGNPLNRDKLITALRAENERLRAALREYECHCPTSVCEWFPCGKTARTALEEKP